MANPLLRWLLREVPEAAEGLAKRVAAQFAEREVNAATRTSAKDALEAIMRQRPEGLNFAAKPAEASDLAVRKAPAPLSFITPSALAGKELPEITGAGAGPGARQHPPRSYQMRRAVFALKRHPAWLRVPPQPSAVRLVRYIPINPSR